MDIINEYGVQHKEFSRLSSNALTSIDGEDIGSPSSSNHDEESDRREDWQTVCHHRFLHHCIVYLPLLFSPV
jgi:hypothetical protein